MSHQTEKPYFVMLHTQRGSYTPLVADEQGDIARFATEDEAEQAGRDNLLGQHYGFGVFDINFALL